MTNPRKPTRVYTDTVTDSWVDYYPGFLDKDQSNELFLALHERADFQSESYRYGGKSIKSLRKSVALGDANTTGSSYAYAGQQRPIQSWANIPGLEELSDLVATATSSSYNFCLANYYATGKAGMGYHSDQEPDLVPNQPIASLSLGATRRFVIGDLAYAAQNSPGWRGGSVCRMPSLELDLHDGDLLVMGGSTQQHYKHSLAKDPSCKEPRINLTYRKHK